MQQVVEQFEDHCIPFKKKEKNYETLMMDDHEKF